MIYHVLSLSTGRPHPLAANDGLVEMPEGRTIFAGASGLCGDYIGATAYSPSEKSTYLVLWNWKTGERKVDAVSVGTHKLLTLAPYLLPSESPCRRQS
jgi:hypothetical protein